ncbi:M18 family aminopeptidase [Endozoicomonas arenosclerae]|uniref:M18 family aminopeptidase n=1 Tax=Endozoicomonas arenosclerae TaxID=1633495 RepID=UPI000784B4B6|nr:M18 family aminopeptidase [Endozoicomonas arenosclerae]
MTSKKQNTFNQALIQFLDNSPTPFHAVKNMASRLEAHGFIQLDESQTWSLEEGGRYYVTRNDSSIVAFTRGQLELGFRMTGAHTDSPCLKLKPKPELHRHQYLQLGVEVYGGALLNPWFDRDLSLAGRVHYLTTSGQLASGLIDYQRAIAIIPSLAIHLDREANKNRTVNPQKHIPPILSQLGKDEKADVRTLLKERLVEEGFEDVAEVLEFDLSFYDTQGASIIGLNNEFITSARLDNLLSCFVGLESLIQSADQSDASTVLVCNDHEEVGSQSAVGAQGPMLQSILERICETPEQFRRAMTQTVMISTDNAHGIHPNYADKHDGNHGPIINQGTVIKINANQRYATNDETAALFRWLCQQEKAECQHFTVRTDMGCGSTIGPITAGELGIKTLDIGLPTFGMHSIRETCGIKDAYELSNILKRFFELKAFPY